MKKSEISIDESAARELRKKTTKKKIIFSAIVAGLVCATAAVATTVASTDDPEPETKDAPSSIKVCQDDGTWRYIDDDYVFYGGVELPPVEKN